MILSGLGATPVLCRWPRPSAAQLRRERLLRRSGRRDQQEDRDLHAVTLVCWAGAALLLLVPTVVLLVIVTRSGLL